MQRSRTYLMSQQLLLQDHCAQIACTKQFLSVLELTECRFLMQQRLLCLMNQLTIQLHFSQSRYEDLGIGDYLNCPMNKEEYDTFVDELLAANRVIGHNFEQSDLFQACQPIEEVARTGQ